MSCIYFNGKILKENDVNELLQEHADFFIEGLTFAEQRSIVKGIAYQMYRSSINAKANKESGKVDSQPVIKELETQLRNRIADNNTYIELEKLVSGEDSDYIKNAVDANRKYETVLNNLSKLSEHSIEFLKSFSGAKVTPYTLENVSDDTEDSDLTETEPENVIERTTFSEHFYFELDSRRTMSSDLQKLLSFVPATTYNSSGERIPVNNLAGMPEFVEFDSVNNELHRILAGTKPTKKDVLKKLEQEKDASQTTKNENTVWIADFIDMYNQQKSHIQKQFNSEMAKHKIEMLFVNVIKSYNKENNRTEYTFNVLNDNSGEVAFRLIELWGNSHLKSDVIKEGHYDNDAVSNAVESLRSALKATNSETQINTIVNTLNTLGININRLYIEEIFKDGYNIKVNNTTLKPHEVIEKLIYILNKTKGDPGRFKLPEHVQFIKEDLIKALAFGSAKYELNEFSNSFRVGGKLIYTYSMNQYMINRFRDLVQDPVLRTQLSHTLYAKHATYLHHLMDTEGTFSENFNVGYVSLEPLKYTNKRTKKSKRSDKITETSELDYETAKTGYFNNKIKHSVVRYKGKEYMARVATFFFPTISDKSRAMSVTGLAYDSITRVRSVDETNKPKVTSEYSPEALELFYEAVVLPEMERIHLNSDKEFIDSINLKSYKGDVFYSLPALNDFMVTINADGKSIEVSLINYLKQYGIPVKTSPVYNQIVEGIRTSLNYEVSVKQENWKKLGLIDTNGKINYIAATPHAKTFDLAMLTNEERDLQNKKGYINKTAKETVMDMVFNYAMFNSNMFQVVIGDPAQYSKKDNVENTYDNIIKRLAAEAAPGFEFEGSDYIQIHANDVMTQSQAFYYLLNLLDGVSKDEYEKMSEVDRKNLTAYEYSNMESTNAQEFTTWKEHIGILRDLGRITDEEYNEAEAAFSKDEIPSKEVFSKVLQPIKPVYSYNTIRPIGKGQFMDMKTYIKSSSFPLIKAMTGGFQIDAVREAMEKLEEEKKMPVRLGFASGIKVGLVKSAVTLTAEKEGKLVNNGDLKEKIDFTGSYTVLSRQGFRIQQDKPYDPYKSEITIGTQSMKLIWANYLDPDLPEKEYKRRKEQHAEYISLFQELYLDGLKSLKEEITEIKYDKDGQPFTSVKNKELSKKLLNKLIADGIESKALRDALKINEETGEFEIPLWLNPYDDKFANMLMGLVKNTVLSKKLPGRSSILGSNVGFKIREGEDADAILKANKNKIVITSSFDPVKGLQVQRDESGKILGAQIMLPFKFLDGKGNRLYLENFIIDGNKLDTNKLSPELLESFGFRIPTQLHANMSYIEVVGFLPDTMGDLVLAPAEFTVQMGSDFDVDALYTYFYNTTYDSRTGILSKIPYSKTNLNDRENHIAGVKNRIIEIHIEMMKDKNLQKSIAFPLATAGFGLHREIIEKLKKITPKKRNSSSVFFDEFNRNKFYDGVAGKAGVGMYSLDSVFNVLSQGKDLILKHTVEDKKTGNLIDVPITVAFGNQYHISNGELSKIKSNKKVNPRYKTEVIAADQNLSVDNANEQGMHVINLNQFTFQVKSILNFLGFEEDISDPFLAQPIIREYVKEMRNAKSIFKSFSEETEKEIVDRLVKAYSNNDPNVNIQDADFSGKDASKALFSMIEKEQDYPNYGNLQAAVLLKFIQLKEFAKPLTELKSKLNLDTKGFKRSMTMNKQSLDYVLETKNNLIENSDKLFGEFETTNDNVYLFPNTTAGFDINYGLRTLLDYFGSYFLETNPNMNFQKVLKSLSTQLGITLNEDKIIEVKEAYKHYLLSNLFFDDIDTLRTELFFGTREGSLYHGLQKLKNSSYGMNNTFLKQIQVDVNSEGVVEINYNNSRGQLFDESSLYKGLIDMFHDSITQDGINPAEIAEQLIIYSLLRGGNKADQFIKFIPVSALKKIVKLPETNRNVNIFVEQFIRHNPDYVPVRTIFSDDIKNGKVTIEDIKVDFVRRFAPNGNVYLYRRIQGTDDFQLADTFGTTGFDEYTPYHKNKSVFKSNNEWDNTRYKKVSKINPLQKVSTDTQEEGDIKQDTTRPVLNKLDFSSVYNLLKSISTLENEYPEYAKLAIALMQAKQSDATIRTVENGTSNYSPTTNTITINVSRLNKNIVRTALHEVLHALTESVIIDYKNGKQLPSDIKVALNNLKEVRDITINNFINDKVNGVLNRNQLYAFLYSYAKSKMYDNSGNLLQELHPLLVTAINKKHKLSNHYISDMLSEVIEYIRQEDIDPENVDKELKDKITDSKSSEITKDRSDFLYSFLDLSEFIAVGGSNAIARADILKYGGKKYESLIKELFEKILTYLGIMDEANRKFMQDIFIVSQVQKDTEPVIPVQGIQTSNTIHISNNLSDTTSLGYKLAPKNLGNYKVFFNSKDGTKVEGTIKDVNHLYNIMKAMHFKDNALVTSIRNNPSITGTYTKAQEAEWIRIDKDNTSPKYRALKFAITKGIDKVSGLKNELAKNKTKEFVVNDPTMDRYFADKYPLILNEIKEGLEYVEQKPSIVDDIYSKLIKSPNVRITQWADLKDLKEPFLRAYGFISHIVSTRIKDSNEHFGNPFSSDKDVLKVNATLIKTESTEESVKKYIEWITNENFDYTPYKKSDTLISLLKKRANWIREQIKYGLKDKPILYTNTSAQKAGEISHADALDYLINKYDWTQKETVKEDFTFENVIQDLESSTVEYTLDSIKALQKINRNKFTSDKLQGWLNDLQKQGVSKQQLEMFKEVAEDGMTKDEIIASLLATYSYTIEIKTALEGKYQYTINDEFINRYQVQYNGENGKFKVIEDDGYNSRFIQEFDTESEADNFVISLRNRPSRHYSTMTVPGGTNYTENEISTPLITPSIKGHAQFSTNNGIGWFRSDVATDKYYDTEQKAWVTKTKSSGSFEDIFGTSAKLVATKTRRILEIQSDLFQKGRDKEQLVGDEFKENHGYFELNGFTYAEKYNSLTREKTPYKFDSKYGKGIPIPQGGEIFVTREEYDNAKEKSLGLKEAIKANQFLQLLNKDNNWVTFFIKSIIQDSVKKGYEKVLFPKGETAAKIEGHETIADEINSKNKEIERLKKDILNYNIIDSKTTIDNLQWRIDKLEEEKANLKSQGIEKLKPIEAFYEIKVGNILEKQFGKNNVKTITDEYGNQWREISTSSYSIKPTKLDAIDEFTELENIGEDLIRQCKGKVELRQGGRVGVQLGSKWSVIKDFKNAPTHENGGIDISISNGKVSVTQGDSVIEAKHGLIYSDDSSKNETFKRESPNSYKWELIKDFKGFPSHEYGGVNLSIKDGKLAITSGDSDYEASCGCFIPKKIKAEEGLVINNPITTPIQRKKRVVETKEEIKEKKVFQKPKLNTTFVKSEDLVNTKNPVRNKLKQDELIKKYNELNKITDKLWKKFK